MPLGCMGGSHFTVTVVSDVIITSTKFTIPGAVEYT